MRDHHSLQPTDRLRPSRRAVLVALAGGVALAGTAGFERLLRLEVGEVSTAPDPAIHLLRRATFGPTQAARRDIEQLGTLAWLEAQLAPASLDTSAVDGLVAALPLVHAPITELRGDGDDQSRTVAAAQQLVAATVARRVHSPAQLHERMVELWSDHFNIGVVDPILRPLKVVDDREVIRPHALGRFADLLAASATSPAMLVSLDNARSFAGAINENYGRELLELHTVGVDGGYTEEDVVATARLFTGWSVERGAGTFRFVSDRHDRAPLTIMGWERPTTGDPFEHGLAFLDWLAHHPSTARTVATKLARRFVADEPDDELVRHLATVYAEHDTAVVPLLRALFTHPTFDASAGAKFQRPLDWLVAALRAVDAQVVVDPDRARAWTAATTQLGQVPFGWAAPDGYPDTQVAWCNAGGLLARWNAAGDLLRAGGPASVPLEALAAPLTGRRAADAVDALARAVRHAPVTSGTRTILLDHAGLSGDAVLDVADASALATDLTPLLLNTVEAQFR